MRVLLPSPLPRVAMLLATLVPALAAAQVPVTKIPGGDAILTGPGEYTVFEEGIVRWHVVFNNTASPTEVRFDFTDDVDPLGVRSCDGGAPCPGSDQLELLCDPPFAPDPDTGAVFECDPVLGHLDIRGVVVPAGGLGCVQFSTRVRLGAAAFSPITNIGCVDVTFPVPEKLMTSPTDDPGGYCDPLDPPLSGMTSACSRLRVLPAPDPVFRILKPVPPAADIEDVNVNGILDVGDRITWRVEIVNGDTADHDAWLYDPIRPGLSFLDFITNPDGLCSVVGSEVQCPAVPVTAGASRFLEFRTTVECGSLTEDDSWSACNRARVCDDATGTRCVEGDDDGVPPYGATCIEAPGADFRGAEKSWYFDDVDADGSLSDGDRLHFRIVVPNDGRRDAGLLTVVDALDATCMDVATLDPGSGVHDGAAGTITWTAAGIPPASADVFDFSVDALESGGATCCNQAFIRTAEREACGLPGLPTDDPATPIPDDATCATFGPQPVVNLTKDFVVTDDADGSGTPTSGDEVEWIITIVNRGAAAATGVSVDDRLLPCIDGFLAASVVIDGEGTNVSEDPVPPAPGRLVVEAVGGADGLAPASAEVVIIRFRARLFMASGQCCNGATASFDQSTLGVVSDDPETPLRGDLTCTDRVVVPAALTVTKSADEASPDACLEPGENILYTLSVVTSDRDATAVVITDQVTDATGALVVVDPGSGTHDPGTNRISFAVGDIDLGEIHTVTWIGRVACDVADGATFSDVATALALNSAPAVSPEVAQVVSAPVLSVAKTAAFTDGDGDSELDAGESVSFQVTVSNSGSCAAGTVTLADQLDVDLDFATIAASGSPVNDGTGGLTWTIPSIAPSGSVTFDVSAACLDPATNGDPAADGLVRNTATATVTPHPACELSAQGSSAPLVIALAGGLLKVTATVADEDLDGCWEAGETLVHALDVEAFGAPVSDVVLTDELPDPDGIRTIVDPDGGTFAAGVLTWSLGFMRPGDIIRHKWIERLSCDALPGAPLASTATADGPTVAPEVADVAGQVDTPVLVVTKTGLDAEGDGSLEPGETVSFSITIENAGTCVAEGVTVTDLLDPDFDWSSIASLDNPVLDALNGLLVFDAAGTPELLAIRPRESVTLKFSAVAIDPLMNPDPVSDGGVVNFALASCQSSGPCAPPTGTATTETLPIQEAVLKLLRNDFISCRQEALSNVRTFLSPRPPPTSCSEPTAIDPLHADTEVLLSVMSPLTLLGDVDPGISNGTCPQSGGDGRVLVYYELDEPPPACIETLRVAKSGRDAVLTW